MNGSVAVQSRAREALAIIFPAQVSDAEVIRHDLSIENLLDSELQNYKRSIEGDKNADRPLREAIFQLRRFLGGKISEEDFFAALQSWYESPEFTNSVNQKVRRTIPRLLRVTLIGSADLERRVQKASSMIAAQEKLMKDEPLPSSVNHDYLDVLNRPQFVFEHQHNWLRKVDNNLFRGDSYYDHYGFGFSVGVSNPRDSRLLYAFKVTGQIYPDTEGRDYWRVYPEWNLGFGNDFFGAYLIGRPFNLYGSFNRGLVDYSWGGRTWSLFLETAPFFAICAGYLRRMEWWAVAKLA